MNWYLTYDIGISLPKGSNDRDAEAYIGDLVNPTRDWDQEGCSNLSEVLSSLDELKISGEHTILTSDPRRKRTRPAIAKEIIKWTVDQKKGVMTGISVGGGWHCIMIVPTPVDYFTARPDLDPSAFISVLDGKMGVSPITYTKGEFTTWWNERIEMGVWHEYLVGSTIPDR